MLPHSGHSERFPDMGTSYWAIIIVYLAGFVNIENTNTRYFDSIVNLWMNLILMNL